MSPFTLVRVLEKCNTILQHPVLIPLAGCKFINLQIRIGLCSSFIWANIVRFSHIFNFNQCLLSILECKNPICELHKIYYLQLFFSCHELHLSKNQLKIFISVPFFTRFLLLSFCRLGFSVNQSESSDSSGMQAYLILRYLKVPQQGSPNSSLVDTTKQLCLCWHL